MTKRNIVHIEIPTSNSKASAEFYQKLFGWHIEHVKKWITPCSTHMKVPAAALQVLMKT